eukprot:3148366-Prymnesium_polylepis.2
MNVLSTALKLILMRYRDAAGESWIPQGESPRTPRDRARRAGKIPFDLRQGAVVASVQRAVDTLVSATATCCLGREQIQHGHHACTATGVQVLPFLSSLPRLPPPLATPSSVA